MAEATRETDRLWYALDLELQANAREAVEYALMEAGALGTEYNEATNEISRVSAYFSTRPDSERIRAELFDSLRIYNLPSSTVRELRLREVEDQDWLAEWKKNWMPVKVGQRFIVAPPWSDVPDTPGRILIRIEPGMAFGTGTHETTRLCLAAIEKHFAGGSFLDVGTGTGILAIAAAKLFPDVVITALDTDSDALAIAQENARLNSVAERIVFRAGTINETTASADIVCANLSSETILNLLPGLVSVVCGRLVLGGILATQEEIVLAGLQKNGVATSAEITRDGEWVSIVV